MTRSQDLPEALHDAGQFYWIDLDSYKQTWTVLGNDACSVYLPRHMVQDIDTQEDWDVAERLFLINSSKTTII